MSVAKAIPVAKLVTPKAALTEVGRAFNGVVVSSGLMAKTVKVRCGDQQWNRLIRKNFNKPTHYLVHDPRSSLRTGDIISLSPGFVVSKNVHHVVNHIITPFGVPISERPAIPTREELIQEKIDKRMRLGKSVGHLVEEGIGKQGKRDGGR